MTQPDPPARPDVTGATEALDGYLARQGDRRPGRRCATCGASPGAGWSPSSVRATAGDIYTVARRRTRAPGATTAPPPARPCSQFPDDPRLPHLATVMTPAEHRPLADALESAARRSPTSPPTGSSSTSPPSPSGTSRGTGACSGTG